MYGKKSKFKKTTNTISKDDETPCCKACTNRFSKEEVVLSAVHIVSLETSNFLITIYGKT